MNIDKEEIIEKGESFFLNKLGFPDSYKLKCYSIFLCESKCLFCENKAKFITYIKGYSLVCGEKECSNLKN